MITNFTMTDAQKFLTTRDIFAIRKQTKGMSPSEIFTLLTMIADETGRNEYALLAETMVIPVG